MYMSRTYLTLKRTKDASDEQVLSALGAYLSAYHVGSVGGEMAADTYHFNGATIFVEKSGIPRRNHVGVIIVSEGEIGNIVTDILRVAPQLSIALL